MTLSPSGEELGLIIIPIPAKLMLKQSRFRSNFDDNFELEGRVAALRSPFFRSNRAGVDEQCTTTTRESSRVQIRNLPRRRFCAKVEFGTKNQAKSWHFLGFPPRGPRISAFLPFLARWWSRCIVGRFWHFSDCFWKFIRFLRIYRKIQFYQKIRKIFISNLFFKISFPLSNPAAIVDLLLSDGGGPPSLPKHHFHGDADEHLGLWTSSSSSPWNQAVEWWWWRAENFRHESPPQTVDFTAADGHLAD